jgi:hypothetical protein
MRSGGETASIAAAAPAGRTPFRPSFPNHLTQETGKRPNGAAAAILAVSPPLRIHIDHYEGIPRLGVAAADTSYVIVRASFSADSPLKTELPGVSKGIDFGAPRGEFTLQICSKSLSYKPSKSPYLLRQLVYSDSATPVLTQRGKSRK